MNRPTDRHRKVATIDGVIDTYLEEHIDRYTSLVYLKFDDMLTRGFGGLAFESEEDGKRFMQRICRTLQVGRVEDMVGVRCWGLFSFDQDDDSIEGIEGPTGMRFTVTGFRRALYGTASSPLDEQKRRLKQRIAHDEERLAQVRDRLVKLDGLYVDWENM